MSSDDASALVEPEPLLLAGVLAAVLDEVFAELDAADDVADDELAEPLPEVELEQPAITALMVATATATLVVRCFPDTVGPPWTVAAGAESTAVNP